jgi:pimeloyl-ACP methyl ester carboxylesterase
MVDPVNRINNNRVAARVFVICLLLLTFLPGLKCAAGESDGYVTAPDGVRLFYHRLGNGPKRVLVPNGHYLIKDFSQLVDSDHTFIFYDLRNRGRLDHVSDPGKLKGGIHLDMEDLEAVCRHFNVEKAAIIGHSYIGLMVARYAMKYPMHVERLIQMAALPFRIINEIQEPLDQPASKVSIYDRYVRISLAQSGTEGESLIRCYTCYRRRAL